MQDKTKPPALRRDPLHRTGGNLLEGNQRLYFAVPAGAAWHGSGNLALVILVHALLVLQAFLGADAGGLGTVLIDILRALALSTSSIT